MADCTPDAQSIAEIQAAASAAAAPDVIVVPTLNDAALRACQDTMRLLSTVVTDRGVAHLALTGGSGGMALAEALAPLIAAQPEPVRRAIHLWFGDERFVPAGDPQRNDLLAAPLIAAGIRESQTHRLAAPNEVSGLDEATARMVHELESAGLTHGGFDVVHVGLGPDAHVCSLFPGHPAALAQAPSRALLLDLRGPAACRPGHGGGRRRRQGRGGTPGSRSPRCAQGTGLVLPGGSDHLVPG